MFEFADVAGFELEGEWPSHHASGGHSPSRRAKAGLAKRMFPAASTTAMPFLVLLDDIAETLAAGLQFPGPMLELLVRDLEIQGIGAQGTGLLPAPCG